MFARTRQAQAGLLVLIASLVATAGLGAQTGVWQPAADLPFSGRQRCTATAFNNKLWVIGGYAYTYYSDIWSSPDGQSWTLVTADAPFKGRQGHAVVVFNGRMWLLGGLATTAPAAVKNDVWSTPDGVTWTLEQPSAPWSPRLFHEVLVYNNRLWVMAGLNSTATIAGNDVWSSGDGINWTQEIAAAPWPARSAFGAATFNNRMWVSSGALVTGGADVWSSADGVNWTLETQAPGWNRREGFRLIPFKGRLWAFGGQSWQLLNDVWSSVDGATWTLEAGAAPWLARGWHAAEVFNDRLWMIPGYGGSTATAEFRRDVWHLSFPGRITSTPPTTATVGVPYHYAVVADGDPVPAISVSGLPGWLSYTAGALSGVPMAADLGISPPITITAANAAGSDSQVFQINVSGTAPRIISMPVSTITAGVPYEYIVSTTGVPAPVLNSSPLPAWLSFNASSGLYSGTPATADLGISAPITVTASNAYGTYQQQFQINVVSGGSVPVSPPLIISVPITTIAADAPYVYTVSAVGTPAPALSASNLPGWLAFNAATGVLSGTPSSADAGLTGLIAVTATSGSASATQRFQLLVTLPPDPETRILRVQEQGGCAGAGTHQAPFSVGALALFAAWVALRLPRRTSGSRRMVA